MAERRLMTSQYEFVMFISYWVVKHIRMGDIMYRRIFILHCLDVFSERMIYYERIEKRNHIFRQWQLELRIQGGESKNLSNKL